MRVEKTLIEIITDPELSKLQRIFEWFKEALNRLALKLGKNPRENLFKLKLIHILVNLFIKLTLVKHK